MHQEAMENLAIYIPGGNKNKQKATYIFTIFKINKSQLVWRKTYRF